jgi:hypothetical protein
MGVQLLAALAALAVTTTAASRDPRVTKSMETLKAMTA